jgi:hypothetical protein
LFLRFSSKNRYEKSVARNKLNETALDINMGYSSGEFQGSEALLVRSAQKPALLIDVEGERRPQINFYWKPGSGRKQDVEGNAGRLSYLTLQGCRNLKH